MEYDSKLITKEKIKKRLGNSLQVCPSWML